MELAIRKNDATKKGERNEKYALANVLTSFTIESEHVLRNEIVLYYVVDEAPLQICLPSQTKLSILQNTETFNKTYSKNKVYESVEYRVSRMSLFRDAQKYCYDELQRIYLPMFQTWEKCNDMLYSESTASYSPALASITSSLLASHVLIDRRVASKRAPPIPMGGTGGGGSTYGW